MLVSGHGQEHNAGVAVPRAPEPAVAVGDDPRQYARLLTAVYEATMAGERAPARPRPIIADSWQRVRARGIDPECHAPPVLEIDGLDMLRESSGLLAVLDDVCRGLESLTADGDNILVVADARGRVLWRSGSARVMRHADNLGFIEGAHWSESAVGTNAIGTALMSRRAVQVFSAEHYVRSHHAWTCAGAPIKDPRTGQLIGVVDVSGPALTVHPATVALVDVVARLAESHLREAHDQALNRLCMVAAPILARIAGPALAVDRDGWVAAVDELPLHNRITLPAEVKAGRAWIPPLGMCELEALPGGWLVRVTGDTERDRVAPRITLDLRNPDVRTVAVVGESGSWQTEVSVRHAEILHILATAGTGLTAPQLADALYGDRSRIVTVRAEMSRLRRQFGGLLAAQPYRFADAVAIQVLHPDDNAMLLPGSTAPAIRAARAR
jgi:hypothetical protein